MTDIDKLRDTIAQLERELQDLESVNEDTRSALRDAIDEIQQALNKDEAHDLEHQSLIDRLNDATQDFEGKHPSFTQTVAGLIDGLGQMGI